LRQTTGSVVCPECGRLVEVGDSRCPFCGRWQPAMFGYSRALQNVFGSLDITTFIFWTCIILYLVSLILDPRAIVRGSGFMDLLAPSGESLVRLGMTSRQLVERYDLWWTPLSATYLHGSLLHIFFNMMWLRMLGPGLEAMLGPGRFFMLYSASGIGGFLLSNALSPHPSVGASGAIFGLLAATVIAGRAHGGEWGQLASRQALMYAGLILVIGFMSPRTNNLAHIGGFIVGGAMTWLLLRFADRAEGPAVQFLAVLTGLATVGSVVASFVLVTVG
jgi:rhomboid protease GluP